MKCGVADGQVERTPGHIIGICAVFRLKFTFEIMTMSMSESVGENIACVPAHVILQMNVLLKRSWTNITLEWFFT